MRSVCIIGLGYIGLPTASLLASKGYQVHGVDTNPLVVNKINQGEIHFFEPDLDELVKDVVQSGYLKASSQPTEAEVFVIAVPTPIKNDFKPDLSFIKSAIESITPYVKAGDLIILESTSPIGTTEQVANWIFEHRKDLAIDGINNEDSIYIAYCPERVLPGSILKELVNNDRIVGGLSERATEEAYKFYQIFTNGKIYKTDARTAELSKLSENAYRDVNIAFANELSIICDQYNINVWELINLSNRHPRVNILQPGPGVGGHCIAIDPYFIINSSPEYSNLLKVARKVNKSKTNYLVDKINERAKQFDKPVIACFGVTYKANIDDMRESPSLEIVEQLTLNPENEIIVVDPYVKSLPSKMTNVQMTDVNDALNQADIIVLLVNHDEFKTISKEDLEQKVLIDVVGLLDKKLID